MIPQRKRGPYLFAGLTLILFIIYFRPQSLRLPSLSTDSTAQAVAQAKNNQDALRDHQPDQSHSNGQGSRGFSKGQDARSWSALKEKFPVEEYMRLPAGRPAQLPRVQHDFPKETEEEVNIRLKRRGAVKKAFERCWRSYRKRAWMRDEVQPISGNANDWFGGYAATLVDSLGTLWIMDMKKEFEEGVNAMSRVDFSPGTSTEDTINVYETNSRHLGGLLGAYDLSGDKRLLDKAIEVADMIYAAFDTPNRMPLTRWRPTAATSGSPQRAEAEVLAAEMGSFSLEFTRLTQLTGEPKYYDAAHRITNKLYEVQSKTRLPGMFNLVFDLKNLRFDSGGTFKLGAMIDSLYEYLPKTYALLGGLSSTYRDMYDAAARAAIKHTLFKPYTLDEADILVPGEIFVDDNGKFYPRLHGEHLGCYAGGMFALGGMLTDNERHLEVGRKLTWGCIWAYKNSPLGIMPETFSMLPCPKSSKCRWNQQKYRDMVRLENDVWLEDERMELEIVKMSLRPGFTSVPDRRYLLRPEAIESVFILYRITGDPSLLEAAWDMFTSIEKHTKTTKGNAALADVLVASDSPKEDRMESFWMAETLKYFYLVFSEPSLISLDEYVFNTRGHPFKRPV